MGKSILWALIFGFSIALSEQDNSNKLWILLDDTSVFQCRGSSSDIRVNEKDVSIRNSLGRQVHYLEAPGTYVLSVHNIQVEEPLPNLSGQINGVLQVPIVSVGQVLNWDFPYQLIPEKSLLPFGGYHCDKSSGSVSDGGKYYCRYCDLCTTTEQVDEMLNSKGHKYLPKEGSSSEPEFDRICTQITAKSYSMQRTISLPDKQELERQANEQFKGIGGEVKKRLNKGKGKLNMEMQLMSSSQKQATRDQVYAQSSSCRCCLPNVKDLSCTLNFLGACNQDSCAGEYASKCAKGSVDKVSCFTVQFNYQVTDKPEEVKAFLQKNHYQDEYNDFGGSSASASNSNNNPNQNGRRPSNSGQQSSGGSQSSSQGSASSAQRSSCINRMGEERFKRLCQMSWQQNFCCQMCGGC